MFTLEEWWYFAQEGGSGWQLVRVSRYPFRSWAELEVWWRKRIMGRSDPEWYRYRIVP